MPISLSPAQTISALGAIISATSLAHVRKTGSFLLTKQLLRPHGVQGLLDVMFGEDDSLDDGVRFEKREHIARMLMTVPANMKAIVSNVSLSFTHSNYHEIKMFRSTFHLSSPV